jgi:hypothetical protein
MRDVHADKPGSARDQNTLRHINVPSLNGTYGPPAAGSILTACAFLGTHFPCRRSVGAI